MENTCYYKQYYRFSSIYPSIIFLYSLEYKDLQATVPGGIYSDLMTNNIIGDIFYGYNDVDTNWIPRLNWTYYRNFTGRFTSFSFSCELILKIINYLTVDSSFLENENINLVLEGLDTFAEIFVNEVKVGESTNMFVQYIFSIKDHIKVRIICYIFTLAPKGDC